MLLRSLLFTSIVAVLALGCTAEESTLGGDLGNPGTSNKGNVPGHVFGAEL